MNIKKELQKARPQLRTVAPLTSSICWGYAVVNVGIGLGMFFLFQPAVPIAIANIFSYQIWGILFFSMGILGGYALIENRWHLVRNLQLLGLLLKAIWAIALIFRCFEAPNTAVITLVWLFFVYIQAVTYIYFTSSVESSIRKKGNG